MIDYWCNAFTPDRKPLWEEVIAADGLTIKLGAREADDFAPLATMVERMDALGIDTLVIPVCDLPPETPADEFAPYAARDTELDEWSRRHPGRFVGMYSVDPTAGPVDVDHARSMLERDWCVALHSHTHSWDRGLDHPDYTPFHSLCADAGVPFVVQAGASGGHRDHTLGHPTTIAEPARRHPTVTFVLSHTGAPWVTETIAEATDHANVVIGTATHPPRRWPPELLDFLRGPGHDRVLWGSGYPLTGHGHGLAQLDALELSAATREALTNGTARRIFTRIPERSGD